MIEVLIKCMELHRVYRHWRNNLRRAIKSYKEISRDRQECSIGAVREDRRAVVRGDGRSRRRGEHDSSTPTCSSSLFVIYTKRTVSIIRRIGPIEHPIIASILDLSLVSAVPHWAACSRTGEEASPLRRNLYMRMGGKLGDNLLLRRLVMML